MGQGYSSTDGGRLGRLVVGVLSDLHEERNQVC